MRNDEPLQLKLAVNLTLYGTMIHIPAYWPFDPKRDICWEPIAKLHHARVGEIFHRGLHRGDLAFDFLLD
jgi:hypothetical protein